MLPTEAMFSTSYRFNMTADSGTWNKCVVVYEHTPGEAGNNRPIGQLT
jgi:hypothetical protein